MYLTKLQNELELKMVRGRCKIKEKRHIFRLRVGEFRENSQKLHFLGHGVGRKIILVLVMKDIFVALAHIVDLFC